MEIKTGIIKWFNLAKKYGFIDVDGEDGDLFFHISGLAEGTYVGSMQKGERVQFEIGQGKKGPVAKNISLV